MDTLKLIKIIFVFLFITTACRNPKIKKYDYQHRKISIKNWNISDNPINKAILYSFNKNTNFKKVKEKATATVIIDNYTIHKSTSLKFDSLPILSTNKDYKLIINDTIIYKISNIKTSYIIEPYIPLSIDSVYNMIKSININSKEYKFDKAGIFFIPKDTYIIEK